MKIIRRFKNRILSVALTVSMFVGMLPASTVYAKEQDMNLWGDTYSWDDNDLWNSDTEESTVVDEEAENSLFTTEEETEETDLFTSEEDSAAAAVTGEVIDNSLFISEEDPVEEIPEVTLDAKDGDIAVTVSGTAEALKGIETVSIKDVTEEKASAYTEYLNGLGDDVSYAVPGVYDITLLDADGKEAEPNGKVSVALSGKVVEESVSEKGQLRVYHDELSGVLDSENGIAAVSEEETDLSEEIEDTDSLFADEIEVSDEAEGIATYSLFNEEEADEETTDEDTVVEDLALVEMDSNLESTDTITFTTDNFSDYALVLAGNDSQKEFSFGDNTYFEMDKYLEKNGEMNGQDAYDIYLENAFYDGSHSKVNSYAPARTDILMAIDQTSSIFEYVDDYNESVETLLKTIAETNRKREAKALAGEYADIDPNFVKQSDANMVSAMRDHYMYIAGIVGFNNHLYERHIAVSDPTLIRSEADAAAMASKCHVKNDFWEYHNSGGTADTDIQDFTRTDLVTKWMYDRAKEGHWNYTYNLGGKTYNWNSLCNILITDGAPMGEEETPTWPYPDSDWPYVSINSYSTNRALDYANRLKREIGALNFGIYVPFRNMDNPSVIKAFESGKIKDLDLRNDDVITLAFLSMWSSDYPINGKFETTSSRQFTGNFAYFNSDSYGYAFNTFGRYIYADRSYPDMIAYLDSLVARIETEAWNATNSRGYFGADTIIQDDVTDPFDVISRSEISVYAVPRIPANLGADGVPTDIDNATKVVSNFRWGEFEVKNDDPNADSEYYSEWVDVTKDVVISLNGSRVTVTGYDFEYNAVTDYDKDIVRYADGDMRSNGLKYKAGDYGYKLVVVIPTSTKFSFGGNKIKTNHSDSSGVIPSDPHGDNPNPPWQENTTLNPDGDKFLDLYPDPEVDLKVSYMLPKDSVTVYAPQTQELHDLLTDEVTNQIWYTDPGYPDLKSLRDSAKIAVESANEAYNELIENNGKALEIIQAEQEVIKATDKLFEAQKNLDNVIAYIPNGINNAFVNIDYEFSDPDGNVLATMHIPHGKAYVEDEDGNGNIDWDITTAGQVLNERSNPIITKSGVYSIKATVTPVDTERAPDWHVHTEADDEYIKSVRPYDSQAYSPTGSSATGSQSAVTVEENPEAYVFTLEVTAADSRREPGQAIDFDEGPGAVHDMIERNVNKHITECKWVCTDGVTESDPENEPGITKLQKVGSDAMLTTEVIRQAYDDGLVESVANVTTVRAKTGEFVPVNILVSRIVGDLNKSVGTEEQTRQRSVIMADDDNIYGDGISSVKWNHNCKVMTNWDCNDPDREFAQAQGTYNDMEEIGHKGKVRYLMHVYENPEPTVEKSTTTPSITTGGEIDWTISVANKDIEKNSHMLASEFTMVDALPWNNDGRIDPEYGEDRKEGSQFGGDLYYTKMTVDFADAASAAEDMKAYYTEDTAVRNASEGQLTGELDGIAWIEAESYEASDTSVGFTIPNTAVAVRLDTKLEWEESMSVNLKAKIKDVADQQTGDYYHNAAWIAQGKGTIIDSNVVSTEVSNLHIAGIVWEDSDTDGLKTSTEPTMPGIKISLYQAYNPMNPNKPVRTINGIQLTEVFDINNEKFVPQTTGSNGRYLFDNIQAGTYYVVADLIPEKYEITQKKAGGDDPRDSRIDSEAETEMIPSGENLEGTAWIKEINVTGGSADNQNIGLKHILGNIHAGKVVNEIYYPSAMTEEEREDYRINCTYILRNTETGIEYRRTLYLKEDTIRMVDGLPQVWGDFNDLPLGTYEMTELFDPNYHLAGVKYTEGSVSFDEGSGTTIVEITADEPEVTLWMENVARPDPPAGDENGVTNPIKIRTPISLEVVYTGPDPVSSKDAYTYAFKASDFDNSKPATDGTDRMGDIIVTYDDGSQIKLSDGTLDFNLLTFNPESLNASMNHNVRRTNVAVYYSERGHMVRDSFNVRVDLKPFYKFKARFFANGSAFDTSENMNQVDFMYNEMLGYNEVTTGTYKDVNNKGLTQLSGFWQAGWNTSPDGQGFQYGDEHDALTPLNKIGQEKKLNTVDLYANWKTNVTFHANGGSLSGGTASWEVAARGRGSYSQPFSKNQSISTSLTASRSNCQFISWNTAPNGTGEDISTYNRTHGGCQGPVTFYAIYMQNRYDYTGYVQAFTAPVSGWYTVTLSAGNGDGRSDGSYVDSTKGSQVSARVHFTVGETVYVLVGGSSMGSPNRGFVSWNGGSPQQSGCGCGAGGTDIRTASAGYGSSNAEIGYNTRLLVAGGGGSRPGDKKKAKGSLGNGPATSGTGGGRLWCSYQRGAGGGYYGGESAGSGTSYVPNIPGRVQYLSFTPEGDGAWATFYLYSRD